MSWYQTKYYKIGCYYFKNFNKTELKGEVEWNVEES